MSNREALRRTPARLGPRFESLESRLCLSVSVSTIEKPNGTELKITGDAAANVINIVAEGDGHVRVTNGNGKLLGAADDVRAIKLDTKGGADTVSYSLVDPLARAQKLIFDLGAGKDSLNLDLTQGVTGVNLNVEVEGGDGADTIDVLAGSLTAARLKLDINGGAGKDAISLSDSNLAIDVDSALVAHLAGNEGADLIDTTLDGVILGRVNYTAGGGKGQDIVTGNITVASGSTGELHAKERGGKGLDTVTLNVIDDSGEDETALAVLDAKIFDRIGGDLLEHTDNVAVETSPDLETSLV